MSAAKIAGGAANYTRVGAAPPASPHNHVSVSISDDKAASIRATADLVRKECECGCGMPVNELKHQIIELRAQGYTLTVIANKLGITQGWAKRLHSIPGARFVRGHYVDRSWKDFECTRCGRVVHRPASSQNPKCTTMCISPGEWLAANRAQYDDRKDRKQAADRAISEVLLAPEYARAKAERELRERLSLRRRDAVRPLSAEHFRREGIAEWLAKQDGELKELVTEHFKDGRRERIQYTPSLDAIFEGEQQDGSRRMGRLGAVYFDREDDMWQYVAGQHVGRRVRVSS